MYAGSPLLQFPILGKSVPYSENPNKVNGLYGIDDFQLKLALSSFYTPRRKTHEERFRKDVDSRSVIVFRQFGIVSGWQQVRHPLLHSNATIPQLSSLGLKHLGNVGQAREIGKCL
jgi:hypothetical protein